MVSMRVAIFISLFGIVLGGSYALAGSEKPEAEKLFRQMTAQLGTHSPTLRFLGQCVPFRAIQHDRLDWLWGCNSDRVQLLFCNLHQKGQTGPWPSTRDAGRSRPRPSSGTVPVTLKGL